MAVTRSARVAPGGAAWAGYSGAAPPSSASFPVSVSGRNLLDANGSAWFGVGDAPWALVGQLTTSEITTYLEDRAAKGYRLVMFSAPEWYYATNAPNNATNAAAFTGTAFQSTLNSTYWAVVDHAVEECERLGITALICPAYWGCCSDGVQTVLAAASNAQVETYGGYIGARYKDYPNIMWLAGHDLVPTATMKSRYEALQTGVAGAGDDHLWLPGGYHTPVEGGSDHWATTSMSWDVETIYAYSIPVSATETAYSGNTLPVVHMEGTYENENSGNRAGDVAVSALRDQAWGSFCAGAVAHIYGCDPIWDFGVYSTETGSWTDYLDEPGAVDMGHLADVMAAHTWGFTVPDTTQTFLTSGRGSSPSLAAARFGGSLGLVYMPTARSITLDLTELSGSTFTVTRIDPTSGASSVLTTTASGSHTVSSQGTNADGDSDWALLIEET